MQITSNKKKKGKKKKIVKKYHFSLPNRQRTKSIILNRNNGTGQQEVSLAPAGS